MTVLMCVVQWLDGDDVRMSTVGWDGCPHQRDQMRTAAIKSAGLETMPELIQSVRFIEVELPIVEIDIDPASVTVKDAA
jgi:hypothetical protein